MTDVSRDNTTSLDAIRLQRDALYEAILGVEVAVTRPATGRVAEWLDGTRRPFEKLERMFNLHLRATEAADGLFESVLDEAPRLANAVARLRAEHEDLGAGIASARERLRTAQTEEHVEAARAALLGVVHGLLTHRHRGAELVYEAFNVDLATGD
jgi:hypothetical protein